LGFDSSVDWIGEDTETEKIWVKAKFFHWALPVSTMGKTSHVIAAALKMAV